MLKWIFIIFVAVVVIVVGGLYGLGSFVLHHATDEDSFSAGIYEKTMESRLQGFCNDFIKQNVVPDEENTEAQFKATCKCFANDMFEKIRDVPPGELEEFLQKKESDKSAQNIFKKCAYQSGLN